MLMKNNDELKELYLENIRLKAMVERLTEQLNNMQLSLTIEETIAAMKELNEAEQKQKQTFNPFKMFRKNDGGTNEADGLSDTMLNPDELPQYDNPVNDGR